jgi:DNA-binding transcriptional MerR regulator
VSTYRIADAERLIGVRSHVLRYWEKLIPAISPAKDEYGRREYSLRDLQILLRLKYLIYERRYTVEGARDALLEELETGGQDALAVLNEIRGELISIYYIASRGAPEEPGGFEQPVRGA